MEFRVARAHVVDMCRTMLERGYLKATEGNVSIRIAGQRLYAVTPSNYDYDRMRVVVNLRLLEDTAWEALPIKKVNGRENW